MDSFKQRQSRSFLTSTYYNVHCTYSVKWWRCS